MKQFDSDTISASVRRHMRRRRLRGLATYHRLMHGWTTRCNPPQAWRDAGWRALREAVIGRRIGDLSYARFCVNQARVHRVLEVRLPG